MEQRPQITENAMMNYSNLGLLVTADGDLSHARTLIDPAGIHIVESDLSDVQLLKDMQATIAAQATLINTLQSELNDTKTSQSKASAATQAQISDHSTLLTALKNSQNSQINRMNATIKALNSFNEPINGLLSRVSELEKKVK